MNDKKPPELKVHSLADYANSPGKEQVLRLLKETIEEIEKGEITPNKILILHLDDRGESYDRGFRNAGLSMSEAYALCGLFGLRFAQIMGFIPMQE